MMQNKTPLRFVLVAGVCALLTGGGCTLMALDKAASDLFAEDEINFKETSYAAADYLIQQARSSVRDYDVIVAKPLSDINHPGMVSTFGKMIPEQIGVRLAQLGYRVELSDVTLTPDLAYMNKSDDAMGKADYILTGSFMRERNDIDVSLRMLDADNNQVIAVFDYSVPMTQQSADLAKPEAQIMRIPAQ